MTEPAHGLMLSDDLIFVSRVAGTARAAGIVVSPSRTAAALLDAAKRSPPAGIILDLQNDGLDLLRLLADLRESCPVMPRVVAYGSHVEAEALRAARQAGCDVVLPRSKFVAMLEEHIKEWLTSQSEK